MRACVCRPFCALCCSASEGTSAVRACVCLTERSRGNRGRACVRVSLILRALQATGGNQREPEGTAVRVRIAHSARSAALQVSGQKTSAWETNVPHDFMGPYREPLSLKTKTHFA